MVDLLKIGLVFFLACSTASGVEVESSQRQKKVFSLFSVVTFPNEQCTGKSSGSVEVLGTCFSKSECTSKGGSADGNCAAGFGVCCTFTINTCGATVSNNCSYIQNPNYPSSESTGTSCSFSVSPLSADICQLRLDFDNFDITETSPADGTCVDTFDVTSGSSRDYYALCGTLTGQHVYIETGRKTSDQTLAFTIATTSTVATWRVKVNQVECYSTSKAPIDCLQYYTGASGSVASLNYPTTILSGVTYDICVRREHGYCGIQWAESATTSPDPFDLNDGSTADALVGGTTASASDSYLSIPGSVNGLYGGLAFSDDAQAIAANIDETSSSIQAFGMPFSITVNSYGTISTTISGALGFNLVYNQIPCGGSNNFKMKSTGS